MKPVLKHGAKLQDVFHITKNLGKNFVVKNILRTFAHRFQKDDYPKDQREGYQDDLSHAQPKERVLWYSLNRKVGRVIDRAGLEIRYTLMGIGGLNPSPSARTRNPASQKTYGILFLSISHRQREVRKPSRLSYLRFIMRT